MTNDVTIELQVDGAWSDISGDVFQRDRISATRGRPDEGSQTDAGQLSLVLDNTGGKYSPRNPLSPLYGKIGRNSPLRVWIGTPSTGSARSSSLNEASHVAPSASPRVTDSLLLCMWGTWSGGAYTVPASMDRHGPDVVGDNTTHIAASETIASPGETGVRVASYSLREEWAACSVLLPGIDGVAPTWQSFRWSWSSGNDDIALTTDPAEAGWWLVAFQLWSFDAMSSGDPDMEPPTSTDGWIAMGDSFFGGSLNTPRIRAWVRRVETAGPQTVTFRADPNDIGYDIHARVYVVSGVPFSFPRFTGEVSEWPPRWDVTGVDVHTPIEAAGILRRLGNAASPLRSALYRGTLAAEPVEYWPMEDGHNATSLASALPGGQPMTIIRDPKLSAYGEFAASDDIPTLQDGRFAAVVREYAPSGTAQVQFIAHIPDRGVEATATLLAVQTTGSTRRATIEVNPDGSLTMSLYDATGQRSHYYTWFPFERPIDGTRFRAALEFEQRGSDVYMQFWTLPVGNDIGWYAFFTEQQATFGAVQRIWLGSSGLGDTAVGHLSVRPHITSVFALAQETNAWRGESAGRRIRRLCYEENIPLVIDGDLDATAALGPQGSDSLLSLLREAAEADMGILGETRDVVGLRYRTHESLYNRPVALTLDYQQGELSPPLEPIADDSAIANDITVQRDGGSSSRAVAKHGPLSVQPPPEGVGRYDESLTLNLHTDEQTTGQAAWRLHMGTVDRLRYPEVTVNLAGNPHLVEAVSRLGQGDRVRIVNLPDWLPPGAADLTVQGTSEELDTYWWQWTANMAPADPYDVFTLDSPTLGRLDTDGTRLAEDVGAGTENNIDVAVYAGMLWTTDPADFPFDIEVAGERMTVTGMHDHGRTFELASYGFEDDTLAPFTTSQDSPWFVQSSTANSGSFSAQSSDNAGVQPSQLTLSTTSPDGGSVSFAWKIESQVTNFLRFYVDGHLSATRSSTQGWETLTFPLGEGEHELTWVYTRDSLSTPSPDAAWVDDVSITGQVQEFITQRAANGIHKSHQAGEEVRLVDTAVLALEQSGDL